MAFFSHRFHFAKLSIRKSLVTMARWLSVLGLSAFLWIQLSVLRVAMDNQHTQLMALTQTIAQQTTQWQSMAQLPTQLNTIETTLKTVATPIESLQKGQSRLDALATTLHALSTAWQTQVRATALNPHAAASVSQKRRSQPTPPPPVPPFHVMSHDQWDGVPMVWIQQQGHTTWLAQGESWFGWRWIELSPQGKWVVFQSPKGQRVKLTFDDTTES